MAKIRGYYIFFPHIIPTFPYGNYGMTTYDFKVALPAGHADRPQPWSRSGFAPRWVAHGGAGTATGAGNQVMLRGDFPIENIWGCQQKPNMSI